MCDHLKMRVVWVTILCVLREVCAQDGNATEPHVYKGILNAKCVQQYYRLFVTRAVPNRDYLYFHEDVQSRALESPKNEISFRIVGGKAVSIADAPYSVLYGLYCGGVLIAPDWVITAAHCKEKDDVVYAGSTYRSKAQPYAVCAHFTHPNWDLDTKAHAYDFDYQLLLLQTPIPVGPNARPIVIGSPGDVKPEELVAVSGWGHINYKDKMQDVLRRVFVPILELERCRKCQPLKFYSTITERMFCAGYVNGTKDACQGDSGGPAIINGKLVGMVSFGVKCAEPDKPGVYSDVTRARKWIREVTALPL